MNTFDREQSYRQRRLVPKNSFDADAGRVGFIYEPSIHDPRNPTDRWSMSFHVTSPRDGEVIDPDMCVPDMLTAQHPVILDDPYTSVEIVRHRHILNHQIARFLASTHVVAAADLLVRCRTLGNAQTRRFIDGLGRLDPMPTGAAPRLAIAAPNIALSCRRDGERITLGMETVRGWVGLISIARIAEQALNFCAMTPAFDVAEIPGPLAAEERTAIAEALEHCGAFIMEAC